MYNPHCSHTRIEIRTVSPNNKKGNAGRKYEICIDCGEFIKFRPESDDMGWGEDLGEWNNSADTYLTLNNKRSDPTTQTVHYDALTKIINQFAATHVFIRLTGGINLPQLEAEVWEAVFQKNYPDCVTSVAELIEVKRTNYSLYNSSKERFVDEMERLYHKLSREHDEKYPEKIYISYTPPTPKLNWAERLSNIGGTRTTANSATLPELAELANLAYFNGHFYAKTPNGCPIETIRYKLTDLNCINSVSGSERPNVNEAIVALANAIINT